MAAALSNNCLLLLVLPSISKLLCNNIQSAPSRGNHAIFATASHPDVSPDSWCNSNSETRCSGKRQCPAGAILSGLLLTAAAMLRVVSSYAKGCYVPLQKQELVPFYIKRALEAYPSCTPITGLSAGVDAAMRELPSGSSVVLLTLQSLTKKASELMVQSAKALQQNQQAGLDLVRLLTQMLLVVEYQFLPEALQMLQKAVLNCPDTSMQLSACDCIHEVLVTSDDYTRKVKCAQWYQQLAASCAELHRQALSQAAAQHLEHLMSNFNPHV